LQAESASTSRRVATPGDVLPGEERVFEAAQRALVGERQGVRAVWPFLGPAFIASVAYVDRATSRRISPAARGTATYCSG
jgi:hypothetical protein